MSDPRIVTEVRDHVFLIGLDRPKKLNAFDLPMIRELSEAFTAYEENSELWCAVVYPTGENFTAGLDLAEVGPAVAGGKELYETGEVDPFSLFGRKRTKPLVHAARGWCLTVGTELALASDICIAATGTKYGQIEVKRGIMPFGGATLRMHQVAGWGNAMRYLLTGDIFEAEEAFRIGLVQQVVEPETLLEAALEMATKIAAQAPLAVQASLASARTALVKGEDAALETLMADARRLMHTEDAQEGVRSFIERRDAKFSGK